MSSIISFIDSPDDFENRDLLGGKGAGLKTMASLGLPVPKGFILTTDAWRGYEKNGIDALKDSIVNAVKITERKTEKVFGGSSCPLFFSVRSGAKYSMPGMMETVLNIGISRDTLSSFTDTSSFLSMFERLLVMYAKAVHGVDLAFSPNDTSRSVEEIYDQLKIEYETATGNTFPEDPYEQLIHAIGAVFSSWFTEGAKSYRSLYGIPDSIGTAAIVQEMVFGNLPDSGTGIFFTRDIDNGQNTFTGNYLPHAQGEEVVNGQNQEKAMDMKTFSALHPAIFKKLCTYGKQLEAYYKDAQDIEFTIERDHLYLLQTRTAKRTAFAKVAILKDLVEEGLVSQDDAMNQISIADIKNTLLPTFAAHPVSKIICTGEIACLGIAVGKVVTDIHATYSEDVILVADYVDANDVGSIRKFKGVITTKGNPSSHMGLILKALNIPALVGCRDIFIDANQKVWAQKDGKKEQMQGNISLDATHSVVFKGKLHTKSVTKLDEKLQAFIDLWEKEKGYSAWASTLYSDTDLSIDALEKTLIASYAKACETFQSQKARTIYALNTVFDQDIFIKSKLFKPDDVEHIRQAAIAVVRDGYHNALRTCYYPDRLANAPYSDGPNTLQEVEEFFSNENYHGKYGGFPRWVQDKSLDAVEVGWQPIDKLNPNVADEHFAATLTIVETLPLSLILTVYFGSPLPRLLEDVDNEDIVTVRFTIDPKFTNNLSEPSITYGKAYTEGKKRFTKGNVIPLTHEVITFVKKLWDPPYALPFTMAVLDKVLDINVLELQGRCLGDSIVWCKIYGVKGSEEKRKAHSAHD